MVHFLGFGLSVRNKGLIQVPCHSLSAKNQLDRLWRIHEPFFGSSALYPNIRGLLRVEGKAIVRRLASSSLCRSFLQSECLARDLVVKRVQAHAPQPPR